MAKRLFVVTAPITVVHAETGSQRTLKAGETLFAKIPVPSTGVISFEQDNHEFRVDASFFLASTALAAQ